MKRVKHILAALLVLCLQTSVCTGSYMQQISYAAAPVVLSDELIDEMSIAWLDYYSCESVSPALASDIKERPASTQSGCADNEDCLQSTSSSIIQIARESLFQFVQEANEPLAAFSVFTDHIHEVVAEKPPPLHVNSRLIAHQLLKRE